MRLVRLGAETSQVGADVRAALSSWGGSDTVHGGVALLGVTPANCSQPVEAILLVPRGVLVVVGVDLPDPTMRLDAPMAGQWKADGWPLIRPDGAVNPAGEALAAAGEVAGRLHAGRQEPIPVSTVVAVGPYVERVIQPTVDLHRGVRVLHPTSKSLLAAVRELAVYDRPCSVDQARTLLTILVGDRVSIDTADLVAEGFPDVVTADLASASTALIPRITDGPPTPGRSARAARPPGLRRNRRPGQTNWLLASAIGLVGLLLIAGIAVAIGAANRSQAAGAHAAPQHTQPEVVVGGVRFDLEGSSRGQDCAARSYGDVQVWLNQHSCTGLARSAYRTTVHGQPAAVAVAVVGFRDAATAKSFAEAAQTPGSGGVNDLVRDGSGWPGGPKSFDGGPYIVTADGTSVRLTEVVWISRASSSTDPALRQLAGTAAGLPVTP